MDASSPSAKMLLLVFAELVFLAHLALLLFAQAVEISLPSGTEVDVPTPEAAKQRFGTLFVVGPQFAVLTLMCHNVFVF